jgi:hypothetical protein
MCFDRFARAQYMQLAHTSTSLMVMHAHHHVHSWHKKKGGQRDGAIPWPEQLVCVSDNTQHGSSCPQDRRVPRSRGQTRLRWPRDVRGAEPTATHWTGRWIRHRLIHNKPQNTTVGKSWNAKNETPYDNVQINAVGDRAHQAHGMASHDTPRVRIERGAGDLECGQGAK